MRPGYLAKRALDYALAAAGLAAAAPVLLALAAAIRLESPGGVLFVQERLGRDGRPFRLLKFRTMKPAPIEYNADGSTRVGDADARVTRIGRYLRSGLDELPQLVNILRGEMSLVGPRPDLVHQRVLYASGEERKLEVLPGITGLSAVIGRTDVPWKDRIRIDVWYIDHWNLQLDLQIVIETLAMALGRNIFEFSHVVADVLA